MNDRRRTLKLIGVSLLVTTVLSAQVPSRFLTGEKLTYSVWLNFVRIGSSETTIKDIVVVDGSPTYHVMSVTETGLIFDKIYKIRDQIESWIDVQGLYSRRFTKSLREGKYRKDYAVVFDYVNSRAITNQDTLKISGRIHDALSVIYCVRAEQLKIGRIIKLNNFDNNKFKLFNVVIHKIAPIAVPAGEFKCFVLEPYLEEGKLFKNQTRLTLYISADTLRLPVMIESNANFGKMVFKLEKRQLQ